MASRILALWFLLVTAAHADQAADERVTNAYRRQLSAGSRIFADPALLGEREATLLLNAVEELYAAGKSFAAPILHWHGLPPRERARWFRLGGIPQEADLVASLEGSAPSAGLLYELLNQESRLRSPGAAKLLRSLEAALPEETRVYRATKTGWAAPPAAELKALFTDPTDAAHFQNGSYANKPRLYLFCRHDRNYPCLLALKDKDAQPVRNADGTLWTQPGLGLSGYGKPFNERLGNTPQGVHLVDAVMPEANDPQSFGKFRRMILEFPAASAGEAEMRKLLPAASQGSLWWRESAIARDIGRGELRIHGTGERNDRADLPFYPFVATIGCVAQRELRYGNTDYTDQRRLLDQVMAAQGLPAKPESEPAIRALLTVIDIDDRKAPVAPADLARFGVN